MKATHFSSLGAVVLTTFILLLTLCATAQESNSGGDKVSRREVERRIQAHADSVNHGVALQAIEETRWAFESERLTDGNGRYINFRGGDRPNVAGFDGSYFYCDMFDGKATLTSRKVNKKGDVTYKYTCPPPINAEALLTLSQDSDYAVLVIRWSGNSGSFQGKVFALDDCKYFLKRGVETPGMPSVELVRF